MPLLTDAGSEGVPKGVRVALPFSEHLPDFSNSKRGYSAVHVARDANDTWGGGGGPASFASDTVSGLLFFFLPVEEKGCMYSDSA